MNVVDILAEYISIVLSLPDSLRKSNRGEPIAVLDMSTSRAWLRFSRRAVARFEANWRVETVAERPCEYLFWRRQ